MMDQHAHKCGYTALGQLPGFGCGFVWRHSTRLDWKVADHYCPRCGLGPFTKRAEDMSDNSRLVKYNARAEDGAWEFSLQIHGEDTTEAEDQMARSEALRILATMPLLAGARLNLFRVSLDSDGETEQQVGVLYAAADGEPA